MSAFAVVYILKGAARLLLDDYETGFGVGLFGLPFLYCGASLAGERIRPLPSAL